MIYCRCLSISSRRSSESFGFGFWTLDPKHALILIVSRDRSELGTETTNEKPIFVAPRMHCMRNFTVKKEANQESYRVHRVHRTLSSDIEPLNNYSQIRYNERQDLA
jgi:hypothetical protein